MDKPGDDSQSKTEHANGNDDKSNEPLPVTGESEGVDKIKDGAVGVIEKPAEEIDKITDDKDGDIWKRAIEKQINQVKDQATQSAAAMAEVKTVQGEMTGALQAMTEALTKLTSPPKMEPQVKPGQKMPDKVKGDDHQETGTENPARKPEQLF